MSFAAPIWLIGLAAWSVLVLWLLMGHRPQVRVPFLHLWPTGAAPARTQRSLRMPPIALSAMLLAILLAILGAAKPVLHRPLVARPVSIVVDRSLILGGREALLVAVRDALWAQHGHGRVALSLVPGADVIQTDSSDWLARALEAVPSSLDTAEGVRAAARRALRTSDWPVIVISGHELGINDERLIQVRSEVPPNNVGLVRLAARQHPAQVMVTVRNQSPLPRAELAVTTNAGEVRRQTIDLPARNGEENYFIDMPALGRVVSVELAAADDLPADNRAWLVRQRSWPRVEAHAALPPELERMISTYGRVRPADEGSTFVVVTTESADEMPAAVVASGAATEPLRSEVPLRVADHPLNAEVDWQRVAGGNARVATLPKGAWQPMVWRGQQVLVAAREAPLRQVWVGLASEAWPRESEFVVFWTNVFDWLGGGDGGERFVDEPPSVLGPSWRRLDEMSGAPALAVDPPPGVWGRADGALRALNVLDVRLDPAPPGRWREQLPGLAGGSAAGTAGAAAALWLGAFIAALVAAMTWPAPRRGAAAPGAA